MVDARAERCAVLDKSLGSREPSSNEARKTCIRSKANEKQVITLQATPRVMRASALVIHPTDEANGR